MSELQAILHEIEVVDKQIQQWHDTFAWGGRAKYFVYSAESQRFDDDTYTSNELVLTEFDKLTRRKGELEHLAEKYYPNPTICKAIGYGFYMHIHNEIRFNDPRFRGCLGLNADTKLYPVASYMQRVAIHSFTPFHTMVVDDANFDFPTEDNHIVRNIRLMWSRVGAIDGVRVVWDYDHASNTLFIQDS